MVVDGSGRRHYPTELPRETKQSGLTRSSVLQLLCLPKQTSADGSLYIVLVLQIPMIVANLRNINIFTTWYLPVVIPLAILYIPVLILLVVTLFRLLAANIKLKEKKLL
ncbi:MAG: hypothetical protein K0Q94_3563 [Paenibacillus sp.]|jgi:hypothetical protein|nr:hypothetical protein [Paenibacillus sp.]